MLSDDELARLRALCDAATPGPWETEGPRRDGTYAVLEYVPSHAVYGGYVVDPYETGCSEADAALIAASRTALPALLDAHARLRAALATIAAGVHRQAWTPMGDGLDRRACVATCPACVAARTLAEVAT